MDLQKVKDALIAIVSEESSKTDWDGIIIDFANEAIAELEKPAEDANTLAHDIGYHCIHNESYGCGGTDCINEMEVAKKIQHNAESYHAKKCAECKSLDALKIAREAMKERRSYCDAWEYKYKDEWDNEDGYINDAIAKLEAAKNEH